MANVNGGKLLRRVGRTLAVTGLGFACSAGGFTAYEAYFLGHSIQTEGRIVANVNSQEDTNYCPVFQFAADGAQYTVTSSACQNPPAFQVGQAVRVNYLKSKPTWAQTDTIGAKWGFTLGFGIAAILEIPLAIFIFAWLRARGQSIHLMNFWK